MQGEIVTLDVKDRRKVILLRYLDGIKPHKSMWKNCEVHYDIIERNMSLLMS